MSKLGRNSDCPCGSGKKYKRCCLSKAVRSATKVNEISDEFVKKALNLVLQHDKKFIDQGVNILEKLKLKSNIPPTMRANIILGLSTGYRHQGLPNKSLKILEELESCGKDLKSDFGLLMNQAASLFNLQHLESACSLHDYILEKYFNTEEQRSIDEKWLGMYLIEAGRAYSANDDKDKALACWKKSIEILENYDEVEHLSRAKANIAFYNLFNAKPDSLEDIVSEIEDNSREKADIGDVQGLANNYCNLGIFFWNQGKYERAIAYLNKDLYLSKVTGNKVDVITSLGNLAAYYILLKQFKKAKDYLWQAEQLCNEIDSEHHLDLLNQRKKMLRDEAKTCGISKTQINQKAICLCNSEELYINCCGKADFEPVSIPSKFGGLSEEFKHYKNGESSLDHLFRDTDTTKKRMAWMRYEQHDGWGSHHEIPDMTNIHLMSAKNLCESASENQLPNVLSAIILSVCSLEAFLNQISFFLYSYKEHHPDIMVPELLSEKGPTEYQRKTSMESKLYELSKCLIKDDWLEKADSWHELRDLIYIRNELVHFKASGYEQVIPPPPKKHKVYDKIPKHIEIKNEPHSWPFRVLSKPLAEWGVLTVESFILEFKSAYAMKGC